MGWGDGDGLCGVGIENSCVHGLDDFHEFRGDDATCREGLDVEVSWHPYLKREGGGGMGRTGYMLG